jgi:hypothetical protein
MLKIRALERRLGIFLTGHGLYVFQLKVNVNILKDLFI